MWLWSTQIADELGRRGLAVAASALAARHVARRYDGPAVDALGESGILALAAVYLS